MRELEKTISTRIRDVMRKKDLNVLRLAEKAEMSDGYLNELLNLKQNKRWNIDNIEKVAGALGVPAWQLFVDPRDVIPPEYLALMEDYQRLDPMRKQIVDDALMAAKHQKSNGADDDKKNKTS